MSNITDRTTYCHRQAAKCASAAAATTLPDAKEAYLNIQRAWLQLAPELTNKQSSTDEEQSPAGEPAPKSNEGAARRP